MAELNSVDKRSNISQKEFYNEYVKPAKPVVITDLTSRWKAMGKLTPEFFKKNYSYIQQEVNDKIVNMGDYIERMKTSTPENPAPYPYSFNVEEVFPELLPDMKPEMYYGKSDRINHPLMPKSFLKGTIKHEFFFGGLGSSFPFLHIDALCLHTQITQLYGDKEFFIYPPEQVEFMYPREDNPHISSVRDIFNPDYEKYPLFKNAKPLSVVVKEGETIFFSTGWWHSTKIHGPSISYGRAHLNSANWNSFVADNYKLWKRYHPRISKAIKAYADLLGRVMNIQESFK